MNKALSLLISLCFVVITKANVRLPAVIGSNMVLQQQSNVKLWGWCSASEKIFVTTSWNNKTDSTIGTRNANWQLSVQTPVAGGPYTITIRGNNTITLENVLIGEVWVCSGQSNMEWSALNGLKDIPAEYPTAFNPAIRFFHLQKATADYPQEDCIGKWTVCDSNTLKSFSAVAYFFGKKLNKDLDIPIGLINTSWGGTPAEVWTPKEEITNDPVLKEASTKIPPAAWWPNEPGKTYNAMIAPIINFSIAGSIWYQGEGNTANPDTYDKMLTTMIDSWRKAWNKEFPFYYVQIAPFTYGARPVGSMVQEAQVRALQHKNVGMIVVTDLVDDTTNIHPINKHDVGLRLANWALSETYKKPGIVYKSPLYKSMEVQKGKAILRFTDASNGLMAKSKTITEVMIAGSDKVFYPAQASIDKDKLVVWSPQVKEPVAVRYAFRNAAIGNLFSKEGLPVSPFRTDNWEIQ